MLIHIKAAQELKECCRKRDAWQQIIDFANYPEVIPQVDAIRIFEQNPHHVRSEWSITLDGAPFSWIEIAAPQQEQFVINSEAISGDFDTLRGKWKIEDSENEGIKLLYFLEYKLGIPVIEENCRDILMAKMQQYITTLVEKQGSRIRKQASEQRRFKRIPLNRFCSFSIDRRIIEANIQNVSRGGMMICRKVCWKRILTGRPSCNWQQFHPLDGSYSISITTHTGLYFRSRLKNPTSDRFIPAGPTVPIFPAKRSGSTKS